MSTGPQNLDTRLLRHRTRRGSEPAGALAADLIQAGRARDALEVTRSALEAHPNDGELLLLDGRARLAAGDLLGAQAALLKAAKALPQQKHPFRWLGEVLMKRGDPERAVKVLDRALAIDPSDRAVAELRARAVRLVNVVSGVDEPSPAAPAKPAEERTVLRTDLTEQLRSMTAEVDAAEEDDDEPTNIVDRERLGAMMKRAGLQEPAKQEPAGSTIAPAIPRPPRVPAEAQRIGGAADALPTDGEIDAALGALDAAPSPPRRSLSSFPAMPAKSAPAKPAQLPAKPLPPAKPLGGRPAKPAAKPLPPAKPLAPANKAKAPIAREPDAPKATPPFAPAKADPRPEPEAKRPPPVAPPRSAPLFDESPTKKVSASAYPPALPDPEPEPEALAVSEPPRPIAEPPASVPDVVPSGSGGPEDVDAILRMLREQGLFEPPEGEPAQWAKRAEVRAVRKAQGAGTRIGVWLGAVWVLAIGAAVGGWYGWQWYVGERHRQSDELVAQARAQAYRGTHADLVDAERHLREARELDAHDPSGPTLLLFVHAQRALEDGAFEGGVLRPSIRRAEGLEGVDAAALEAARAVLAASEGNHERAAEKIAAALEASPNDAAILYLAGRLEQRLAGENAVAHLEAAAEADGALVAPRIALAEVRHDEGQAAAALALLDEVLAQHADHLRAKLWRAFLASDTEEPGPAMAVLDALEQDVRDRGAPTDRVLRELARARLLRRQGQTDAAGEAVDAALMAGASEPRLLALVASEGRRAGRMLRALQAARTAVAGAPENPELRKLLAEIELARRDGRSALSTLAELDSADPDVVAMRAQAALLIGSEEVLRAAVESLDARVREDAEVGVELKALRLRMHARLGASNLLSQARALSREAPGEPGVALALGEVALAARDADDAVEALGSAVQASPDDAEAHYLLGRARRMAGDGEGAEQSFRRAVELTPEHTEARLALGGLLLDMGSYEAADALYTELASSARTAGGQAVTVAGRLGRVEALTGLGRLDDAAVQLEALQEDARALPSARIAAARLALARRRAGDALGELRPLATEGASPAVLALYADALLMAGQVEPAADTYAAAIAGDSGLPEALLGQAEMAVRSDRERDALELLDRLARSLEVRVRPPSMRARMHFVRGRAHLLGGRDSLAAAREALRAAIAIEGAPAAAHFFLGEALAGENSPEARASYQRYLELAPEGEYAARARRAIRR